MCLFVENVLPFDICECLRREYRRTIGIVIAYNQSCIPKFCEHISKE